MASRASTWLGIALLAIATGCSAVTSTDSDELYPGPGSSMDAGTGTRDSGTPAVDTGTPPRRDSGTPPERDSGTPPRDSGVPPERDSGPVERDAGPTTPVVPCGDMSCERGTGTGCCFAEGSEPYCYGGGTGRECTCEGTFCDTTEVTCNGASDCPGEQRCCAFFGFTGGDARRIECAASCEGGTITDAVEVCDPSDPAPCASAADECHSDSRLPDGYALCRPD